MSRFVSVASQLESVNFCVIHFRIEIFYRAPDFRPQLVRSDDETDFPLSKVILNGFPESLNINVALKFFVKPRPDDFVNLLSSDTPKLCGFLSCSPFSP